MNLWLDDIRTPPSDGNWKWAKTAHEAVDLISEYHFKEVSLDHDLGHDLYTGYWFLSWMECEIREGRLTPPIIHIHSQNPVGVTRMKQVVDSIARYLFERDRLPSLTNFR